jgi:hypothetical protein
MNKMLKSNKPADLAVEQPTKLELAINLKTAKQIGVTISPNTCFARADRVVRWPNNLEPVPTCAERSKIKSERGGQSDQIGRRLL